jgi:lysylphosphatidylglycerol synthetase-like protein (DUF2156 family)
MPVWRLFAVLRRVPATAAIVCLLWTLGVATGSLRHGPDLRLRSWVGVSLDTLTGHRPYTLVTSAFWASHLTGYVVATLFVVVGAGITEYHWGTGRMLLVALFAQIGGTLAGLAVVAFVHWSGVGWPYALVQETPVGPIGPAAAAIMGYSAATKPLWRRRIRLTILVGFGTLVLYGGLAVDALRLAAAVVGMGVGVVMVRPARHQHYRDRYEVRTLVALLLTASAVGGVLAALSPSAVGPLSVLRYLFASPDIDPAGVAAVCADAARADACRDLYQQLRFDGVAPSVLAVLPAVLVVILALGLRRGRHFAWAGSVALHALLASFAALVAIMAARAPNGDIASMTLFGRHGLNVVFGPVILPALVVLVLVWSRRAFRVFAPPGTYGRVGRVVGLAVIGLFVLYVAVGQMLAGQFNPRPSLGQLARDFPERLMPAGYLGLVDPAFVPTGPASTVLYEWTGVTFWCVLIGLVLRSYLRNNRYDTDADADEARTLLEQYGSTALSYLTTWRGNSYLFTPGRLSYVAYRVNAGVAIALCDPVGPPDDLDEAVHTFARFCTAQGWEPCWHSVTGPVRDAAARLGWSSIQVAEETVLPLATLAFTGRRFQDVRTAFNRAQATGVRADWVSYPEAPAAVTDQIEAISAEWLSDKDMPPMGFTLGGLEELNDQHVRLLLAIDGTGSIHGFTSWLPVYRDRRPIGWTLDVMRRRDHSFNGTMEFLIASAALQFKAEGAEFVSLSGSPLARRDRDAHLTGFPRLLSALGNTLEPVYGFQSLLAFKAKFQPDYQPLYLCYADPTALPQVGNAIIRAYVPDLTLRQQARIAGRLINRPTRARSAGSAARP